MELKLFSDERSKHRIALILIMASIFAYGVWRLFNDRVLANWKDPEEFIGNLIFIIVSLFLPLMAVINTYRRKTEGVAAISMWMIFSVIALEMGFFLYGPTFAFPNAWWPISVIFILLYLIGSGDLLRSLWYRSPSRKLTFPLGLNKTFQGLLVFMFLAGPIVFFIWADMKMGLPYPEFSAITNDDALEPSNNSPNLPFDFQVNLPSSPELFQVNPKDGSIQLKTEKNLWTLGSVNQYDQQIQSVFHPSKKPIRSFITERYGFSPNLIKDSYFGEKPDYFFEIRKKGLWGAVSVMRMDKKRPDAIIRVYLWDDAGMPLGAIQSYAASTAPQDWKWVYSIRRTASPFWSPENYTETAENCLTHGQKSLAGIYFAAAVIADKDKPPRLKSLIEFLQKYGWKKSLAKFQLDEALKDYPQDPILKSIQLTGGVVN